MLILTFSLKYFIKKNPNIFHEIQTYVPKGGLMWPYMYSCGISKIYIDADLFFIFLIKHFFNSYLISNKII